MALPQLTDEQRAAALEKAAAARRARAQLKERLKRGDTTLKQVLADEILFGQLQNGGKVEVDEQDGKLVFSYSTQTVPAVPSTVN